VIGFSEAIEQELAPRGVAVSIVMLGIVRTELSSGIPDLPGLKAIAPESVVEAIAEALCALAWRCTFRSPLARS